MPQLTLGVVILMEVHFFFNQMANPTNPVSRSSEEGKKQDLVVLCGYKSFIAELRCSRTLFQIPRAVTKYTRCK